MTTLPLQRGILYGPVASRRLVRVPPDELERLALVVDERTGVRFRVFSPRRAAVERTREVAPREIPAPH